MKYVHFTEKPEGFDVGQPIETKQDTFCDGGLLIYKYNPACYDEMAAGWGRVGVIIESDDAELYQESPLGNSDYDEYIIYEEDFPNTRVVEF